MSDCVHCEIHNLLEAHLQAEGADLMEISAKVTEVLADLIMMAPPKEQAMLMAEIIANLGSLLIDKGATDSDETGPRPAKH